MDLVSIIFVIVSIGLTVNAFIQRRKLEEMKRVLGSCAKAMSDTVMIANLAQSTINSLLKVAESHSKDIEHVRKDLESFKQAVSDFSMSTTERLMALSEARKERVATTSLFKKNDKAKPN